MRTVVVVLCLAANTFAAGPLIVGGRGGTAFNTTGSNNAFDFLTNDILGHNYAIGPTVGVRLPLNFSVEADALYNRRSLGFGLGNLGGLAGDYTHADWWEFPVMLKFAAGNGPIAPVFGAGMSFQRVSSFGSIPSYIFTGRTSQNSVGFVAGGGVQFRAGALAVTPELRYTRWTNNNLAQTVVDNVLGGQNQAQFLVGFTF
jgi:hypothetical protein